MQAQFWHDRWEQNQIGFHQQDFNPHLQTFWDQLSLPEGETVFVPLCGKSRDMLWLRAQGYPVLGIELSPVAVRDFFAENRLEPRITPQGKFQRWEADGLVILHGDFFDLTAADLQTCSAVFDRASLIALPPPMRPDYVRHFHTLFPVRVPTLLVTLEYDQTLAKGPPFAVLQEEVRAYYAADFDIHPLHTLDVSQEMSGLTRRGVKSLLEQVYLLRPR